jgi:hypothetical protein
MKYATLEDRLLANSVADPKGDCWLWTGKCKKGGNENERYGHMNVRVDGRHVTRLAHRVAYEAFVGPIPDGFDVDHTCENCSCINPAHLEAVPPEVNQERRIYGRHQTVGSQCAIACEA